MNVLGVIAERTDGWFRTRRSRRLYSAVGLALWIASTAAAFFEPSRRISHCLIALVGLWLVSCFVILFRDQWENRR